MTTPTMVPPGWYDDPTGRHEYRYWDGKGWTPRVSDHGATTTDAWELLPPKIEPSAPIARAPEAAEGTLAATAQARAYRARAVPRIRVAAAWTAVAAIAAALVFEIVASAALAGQTGGGGVTVNMPSESTFAWWAWLYHYTPSAVTYAYPAAGLVLALILALIFLGSLILQGPQALRKAGLHFRFRAGAERRRLAQEMSSLGRAKTLFRARGRRGLLVAAELAALAVTGLSAYAIIGKTISFDEFGNLPATSGLSVGLGPKVCLIAGIVAIIAGLFAWPWTKEQYVVVRLDGTIRLEQGSGSEHFGQESALTRPSSQPEYPAADGEADSEGQPPNGPR